MDFDESTMHGWARERVRLMRELGIAELEFAGLRLVLFEKKPAKKKRPAKDPTK